MDIAAFVCRSEALRRMPYGALGRVDGRGARP